jgi:hypothetical protein
VLASSVELTDEATETSSIFFAEEKLAIDSASSSSSSLAIYYWHDLFKSTDPEHCFRVNLRRYHDRHYH